MTDILTLGELLIDLTEKDKDGNGNRNFTAYPGGAPANVAVAASRLGAKTGFIGKVGNDPFGHHLKDVLKKEKVATKGLYLSEHYQTTLAIVAVSKKGDREFSFYRSPGADTQLYVKQAMQALDDYGMPSILHVGSLSMTTQPSRGATEEAVRYAKDNGVVISYDPNYRPVLWNNESQAIRMMSLLLPYADIIKVADDEMTLLTGTEDYEEGSRILAEDYGVKLVIITLGKEGVFVRYGDHSERVPGVKTKVVDTNGAGDTFLGAVLAKLASRKDELKEGENVLDHITPEELRSYVEYANRAAALTCSRPGAMPAMPTKEEMEETAK